MAAPWHDPPFGGWIDHAALAARIAGRLGPSEDETHPAAFLQECWREDGGCLLAATVSHAEDLLVPHGDHWRLRETTPPAEILRWRALTQRLPAGLWVAAAADGRPPPREVRLLTPDIAPVSRTAHLHLHGSAIYPFEALWTALMIREPPDFVCDGGLAGCAADRATVRAHVERWRARLALLRVLRIALERALRRGDALDAAIAALLPANDPDGLRAALEDLLVGRPVLPPGVRARRLVRAARAIVGAASPCARTDWRPAHLDAIWRADPIGRGEAWPEGRLLSAGFRRLARSADRRMRCAFMAYLGGRHRLYAHLVTDPGAPGLAGFAANFGRADPYVNGLERIVPSTALISHALELGAVEIRATPATAARWIRRGEVPRSGAAVECAVIAHFVRHKSDKTPARRIRRLLSEGRRLARLLESNPEVSNVLRAIDIAGDERAGMAWQALPALRAVRRVGFANARRFGTPPIRTTLHVGEDFGDLLSGLRAVDQPRAWGLLQRGDRLGHALALGVDPKVLPIRRDRVEPLVRMLDLVWVLDRLDVRYAPDIAEWRGEACRELEELGRALLGQPFMAEQWRSLVSRTLRSVSWLEARSHMSPGAAGGTGDIGERFLGGWLHREQSERDHAKVSVYTDPGLLKWLQDAIAVDLARLGVFIELNPSSNLTVAGQAQFIEHERFRRLPWQAMQQHVTLSADDPLQFATCLADEYAYAWAAQVYSGVSPSAASDWLEQIARNAWRARFTLGPVRRRGRVT